MIVSLLVEKENPNNFVADLHEQSGGLYQQSRVGISAGHLRSKTQKGANKNVYARNRLKKEVIQKKTYTEEANIKDGSWNIYTGNPGYYTTSGDTVYFGTAKSLSDSAFLKVQRTVVPISVKPYGLAGKERTVPGQDWILGLILILWMIFASVRVEFPEYLSHIFSGLVNLNAATRLFRQRGYKMMYGTVRLDLIFYLIVPLSVFQIARFFKVDLSGFPPIVLFIGFMLVINTYFFVKIFIHRLIGSITMLKDQTDELNIQYQALL